MSRVACVAGLVILFGVVGCQTVPDSGTPYVRVYDQVSAGETLTIEWVVSAGTGWIVIQAQHEGRPGPVIGYSAVASGVNRRVVVKVDAARTTGVLYAVLSTDAGRAGVFEFPDADVPVTVNGKAIAPLFTLNAPAQESSGSGDY